MDSNQLKELISTLNQLVNPTMSSNTEGLGFTDSTGAGSAIYVFIKRNDNGAECWHILEGEGKDSYPVWIPQKSLRGYITGLSLAIQKSDKYGDKEKLDIHVKADSNYVIRVGADTAFARGFISQLLEAQPGVISIGVEASDEDAKVVFPSLSQGGRRITPKWIKQEDFGYDAIEAAALKVGATYTVRSDNAETKAPATTARSAPAQAQPDSSDQLSKGLQWLKNMFKGAQIDGEDTQLAVLRNVLKMPGLTWAKLGLAELKVIRTALTNEDKSANLQPLRDAHAIVAPKAGESDEFGSDVDDSFWGDDNT